MHIVTDSGADLLPEEIEQLGITVAPLFIQFPEGEISSEDLTPDEFYNRLRAMAPQVPSTNMPSPGIFSSLYQALLEKGKDVLSLHISSGLSGTIGAARLGAAEFGEKVSLFDTMTLSGGERFHVIAAALAAKAGHSLELIHELLEKIRDATEVIYTLDTLEYLERGGRIGRVQALASSLLKIKPVIKVDKSDGKYSTVGTGRSIKRTLDMMVSYLEKTYTSETPLWVSVMHGQFQEQAETLAEMLKERLQVARLEILRISPVLGVHTGPGIVGVTAVPMALMSGLM